MFSILWNSIIKTIDMAGIISTFFVSGDGKCPAGNKIFDYIIKSSKNLYIKMKLNPKMKLIL
jgi:hypothetical protein